MRHEVKPGTPELRKKWRAYWEAAEAEIDFWREHSRRGYPPSRPHYLRN